MAPKAPASTDKICAGCNGKIQGMVHAAMGKIWHPEHFVCAHCKMPIAGGSFNIDDDKPYCKKDYLQLFSKKCKKCGNTIDSKVVTALGENWHPEHFVCTGCEKQLDAKQFYEKDNAGYCKGCYEKNFCPQCKGCNKPISDTVVTALDAKWHKSCFKCSKCAKPITGGTPFALTPQGKPICDACTKAK